MYDTQKSYLQNYQNGPDPKFVKNQSFPKIKYKGKPKFEFLGVPLYIPFGVPAGPLLNSDFVKVALDAGFCLPTYKTVRSGEWESHAWPNILKIESQTEQIFSNSQLPKVTGKIFSKNDYANSLISISNSFGVPSKSPQVWHDDFLKLKSYAISGYHVVLSFQGTIGKKNLLADIETVTEYAVNALEDSNFCFLEMNLSCPNESNEPLYKSCKNSVEVLKSSHQIIKNHPKIKLIAKIGAMDFETTYKFVSEVSPYVNALSAINTVSANISDENGSVILGSKSQVGGVCGNIILRQGLLMCEYLSMVREKCKLKAHELGLIGVGGVSAVSHFNNYRDAGADVVQAAIGMMWNLDLAQQIARHLNIDFDTL